MNVLPAPAATPSGASWTTQFPTSTSTTDLDPSFRPNAENFISALTAAGASVDISTTERPKERAYLMHYAWKIAKEGMDPSAVPAMAGVNIDWVHKKADGTPDLAKSKAAAQAMVDAYQIVYAPVLSSRHTERLAVDMTISWTGPLKIKNATGTEVNITSTPRTGTNADLIQVGKTYGVIKLESDPPHWSSDGH